MDEQRISISLLVTEEGIYATVQLDHLNFACLTAQPSAEMAIASAAPFIRSFADEALHRLVTTTSPSAATVDPPSVSHVAPEYRNGPTAINDLLSSPTISWSDAFPGTLDRPLNDPINENCTKCGGEGRIADGWADDGDVENGPNPYVTSFHYCDCAIGVREEERDKVEEESYFASQGLTVEEGRAIQAHEDAVYSTWEAEELTSLRYSA